MPYRLILLSFVFSVIVSSLHAMSQQRCAEVTAQLGRVKTVEEGIMVIDDAKVELTQEEQLSVLKVLLDRSQDPRQIPDSPGSQARLVRFLSELTGVKIPLVGTRRLNNPLMEAGIIGAITFGETNLEIKRAFEIGLKIAPDQAGLIAQLVVYDVSSRAMAAEAERGSGWEAARDANYLDFENLCGGADGIERQVGIGREKIRKLMSAIAADPNFKSLVREREVIYRGLFDTDELYRAFSFNPSVLAYIYATRIWKDAVISTQTEKAVEFFIKLHHLPSLERLNAKIDERLKNNPALIPQINKLLMGGVNAVPGSMRTVTLEDLAKLYTKNTSPTTRLIARIDYLQGPIFRIAVTTFPELQFALSQYIRGQEQAGDSIVEEIGGLIAQGRAIFIDQETKDSWKQTLRAVAEDLEVRNALTAISFNRFTHSAEPEYFFLQQLSTPQTMLPFSKYEVHPYNFRPQQMAAFYLAEQFSGIEEPGESRNFLEIGYESLPILWTGRQIYHGNIVGFANQPAPSKLPQELAGLRLVQGNFLKDRSAMEKLEQKGPYHSIVALDFFKTRQDSFKPPLSTAVSPDQILDWMAANLAEGGRMIIVNDMQDQPPFSKEQVVAAGLKPIRWNAIYELSEGEKQMVSSDHPQKGQLSYFVIQEGESRARATPTAIVISPRLKALVERLRAVLAEFKDAPKTATIYKRLKNLVLKNEPSVQVLTSFLRGDLSRAERFQIWRVFLEYGLTASFRSEDVPLLKEVHESLTTQK